MSAESAAEIRDLKCISTREGKPFTLWARSTYR